ncbi:MAG TPA: IgGFc-binding protein [Enhygromyxa sp.]|nr:IgGFc-binding protein [Enhygromyxa sp.]
MSIGRRFFSHALLSTAAFVALLAACADEGGSDGAVTPDSTEYGDGDGDGDTETGDTETGDGDGDDATPRFCEPGTSICKAGGLATCLDDGSAYGPLSFCTDTQQCRQGACHEKCELITFAPSSVGCSFFAHKMDNYTAVDDPQPEPPDSFVIGNISNTDSATVQLYYMPEFSNHEMPLGDAVVVPPGRVQVFEMDAEPIESVSYKRQGGTYRVQSNIPVVAYLHSPLAAIQTNDASMLLPEHALRQNHVVASYYPWLNNYYPSYFNVIAIADNTTVTWNPPVATLAGIGVPDVPANGTGQVMMNRGDTLQVVAANHIDVSGTYVSANKPIALISGSEIVNVPAGTQYADHIEEQMLPLDYWGQEYVGPRAPPRGTERFHWRIYAGADNVTINASPNPGGFPINLDRGEWHELETTTSHVFTGSGPFMPVQYLAGKNSGATTGDPSMVQMVPTEQFLDAYAFTTGIGYDVDYVQVIREQGGADVFVDGVRVDGYYSVGNYEVSDWVIAEGNHFARSSGPFGIINLGYTSATSYAYPGGMALTEINPQ